MVSRLSARAFVFKFSINLALIGGRVQMVIARFQPACYAFGYYHDLAFTET